MQEFGWLNHRVTAEPKFGTMWVKMQEDDSDSD